MTKNVASMGAKSRLNNGETFPTLNFHIQMLLLHTILITLRVDLGADGVLKAAGSANNTGFVIVNTIYPRLALTTFI